jgi:uncharacterized protein YjiS (DUF1127 family)
MSNYTGLPLSGARNQAHPSLAKRLFDHLGDRFRRFTAVNELAKLSDRQLRDIGVDRRQIEAVVDRESARLKAQIR